MDEDVAVLPSRASRPLGAGFGAGTVGNGVRVPELFDEEFLRSAIDVLVRLVEAAGALVIFLGAAIGFVRFVRALAQRRGTADFVALRLELGRYLALGLEFQLAGDVLRTAIAPTFAEIGQLAAVAAIRTALNYFLEREIKEEREEIEQREQGPAGRAPT